HSSEIATVGRSNNSKSFRQRSYFVAVAVPNVELIAQSIEEFRSIRHLQHSGSILAASGENDASVKMMRHQHQSVTNSQYWNAQRKDFRIDVRRAFVVNAGWPTRKDQSFGLHCGNFSGRCVEANDLRIHLAFPDPTRDDLRVLRTKIENENFRVCWAF